MEPVTCGNCGASLDVPEGVQFVNCRHCGSSLKVQRTESMAFTEVMQTLKDQSARIAENTDVIRIQNEITLLDQDWQRRSEELMVRHKDGRVSAPGEASSVISGVLITVFGTVWTVIAGAMAPPMILFGMFFIAFGLWNSVNMYQKAGRYRSLKMKHEQERRQLQSRLRSIGE